VDFSLFFLLIVRLETGNGPGDNKAQGVYAKRSTGLMVLDIMYAFLLSMSNATLKNR
jgi:hypothetical protein